MSDLMSIHLTLCLVSVALLLLVLWCRSLSVRVFALEQRRQNGLSVGGMNSRIQIAVERQEAELNPELWDKPQSFPPNPPTPPIIGDVIYTALNQSFASMNIDITESEKQRIALELFAAVRESGNA